MGRGSRGRCARWWGHSPRPWPVARGWQAQVPLTSFPVPARWGLSRPGAGVEGHIVTPPYRAAPFVPVVRRGAQSPAGPYPHPQLVLAEQGLEIPGLPTDRQTACARAQHDFPWSTCWSQNSRWGTNLWASSVGAAGLGTWSGRGLLWVPSPAPPAHPTAWRSGASPGNKGAVSGVGRQPFLGHCCPTYGFRVPVKLHPRAGSRQIRLEGRRWPDLGLCTQVPC